MSKILTKILIVISIFLIAFAPIRILFAANNSVNPTVNLNTPIPGHSGSTDSVANLAEYLTKIYNFGIAIAGILALVMITWGGVIYLTSAYAGNVVKAQSGRAYIDSALIGLAMALLSYLLMYTIGGPELVNPKNVFLTIPPTTCTGGFANIENERKCQEMCTTGQFKAKANFNSATKCCQCDASCVGQYVYPGTSLGSCDAKCKSECPAGKTCRMDNVATEECCKCYVTQFEDPAAKCEGGTKILTGVKCNEYCSPYGGTTSYDMSTQCCKCKSNSSIPVTQQNCDDYCPNICDKMGTKYDKNGTEHDASGSCICSCY